MIHRLLFTAPDTKTVIMSKHSHGTWYGTLPGTRYILKSVKDSGGLLEIILDPPENFLPPLMSIGWGDRRRDSEIFREICQKIPEIFKSASEILK